MFLKIEEALDYVSTQGYNPKYTTHNIIQALEALGHPESTFKSIHITGTNGKGSVTRMVYQVLREAGYSVGVFLSPHLLDMRERFVVDDMMIDDALFLKIVNKIAALDLPISRFEKYVLIAFEYYKEKKVDYAVVEVGVGAKNDATNIILPEVSVITSLWLDHAKTLWATLDEIADHKSWIIKPHTPVVLWVYHPLFEKVAKEKEAKVIYPVDEKQTNLLGEYQKKNAALAYEVCKELWIDETIIYKWLQKVKHRGRLEYVLPNLLIDGAHNIDGLSALKEYLETVKHSYDEVVLCFSLKKNKVVDLIVETFWKKEQYVIVGYTQNILEPIESLTHQLLSKGITPKVLWVEKIIQKAKKEPRTLYVVFGSLYMIGQFLKD